MSNSIIEVNNLSKSYTITHEGRERYTALRDVMAQTQTQCFCHADPDSYREKPVRLAIQAGISTKLLNIPCHIQ